MSKYTQQGTTRLNPPFDPNMLTIGSPSSGSKALRRGWIATDNSENPPLPGRVDFLFNPPSISVSHPLNSAYPSTSYKKALQATAGLQAEWVANTLGQAGEVSLSLLFDRTYELWLKKYAGTPQATYGAYADVLAFYKLLGIVDSSTQTVPVPLASGTDLTVTQFGLYPQKPLNGNPILYFYMGPNSLRYRGFVDNLNVTYTHFSAQMVPIRAQVDISIMMYGATGHTTGGGTTYSAQPATGAPALPPPTVPHNVPVPPGLLNPNGGGINWNTGSGAGSN